MLDESDARTRSVAKCASISIGDEHVAEYRGTINFTALPSGESVTLGVMLGEVFVENFAFDPREGSP